MLDASSQGFVLAQRRLRRSVLPQGDPHELIRVEVRRVGRQKMKLQLSLGCCDVLRYELGLVAGVPIHDEEHRTAAVAHGDRNSKRMTPGRG